MSPTDDATLIWTAADDWEGGWGGWHAEFARVELAEGGLTATGTQLGIDPGPYKLEYRLDAGGEGFVTRSLQVEAAGDGWERRLCLKRDAGGRWTICAEAEGDGGLPAPGGDAEALAGALDCDLGFSPLTNAMPVLRHNLHREPGQVEFLMAWVSVPDLSVHPLAQRYTHLAPGDDGTRVRYESLEGNEVVFAQDLELDVRGLVRLYPELGRRIG